MNYTIHAEGPAAYMQLYSLLKQDIVTGTFPYGSRLPSKRLLAEETGVSVITVEHAYAILCDEGYAEARQRRGYFVIYREADFLFSPDMAPLPEPTHSRPAHSGQFPFSVLAKTARKVLQDYGEAILIKSPNQGCLPLRQAIAAHLARSCGIHASAEQIVIGAGAEYLYSLILQLLGNHRIFGVEDPGYEKIRRVYAANGVTTDPLKLGQKGIHTSELERTGATVLHVTPFHSYPSGVTATASKRQQYLRWAEGRNGYIIEDNYDSEMTVSKKNEDTLFSLCSTGRVIYLNTFSRTIAPSFRVGYMVLPQALGEEFRQKLGFYSCTVPVFEQYILSELLRSGDFERHINRIRRARRKSL